MPTPHNPSTETHETGLWVAFRWQYSEPEEFIGVADSMEAAQAVCLSNALRDLDTFDRLQAARVEHGHPVDPRPQVALIWEHGYDVPGEFRTTQDSVRAFPYSPHYLVHPVPLHAMAEGTAS